MARRWTTPLCSLALLPAIWSASVAEIGQDIPTGGTPLISTDLGDVSLNGSQYGEMEVVPVEGMPFGQAWRFRNWQTPGSTWQFELIVPVTGEVNVGDVIFVQVYARALEFSPESGEAQMTVNFQTGGPGWDKSVAFHPGVRPEWERFDIPFVVQHDHEDYMVAIHLGFAPQTIEVGGLRVLNYGDQASVEDFPASVLTYMGREEDAPWRAEADARIREHRMGDLEVLVLGSDGAPIPGARVEIEQQRHAFGFGTAINAQRLVDEDEDAVKYRGEVERLFNVSVIENHLKWPMYETQDPSIINGAVDWLLERNIPVRGHVMVWPGFRNLPGDIRELADDPDALRARVENHIRRIGTDFRGRLFDWDVVNEPFDNYDLLDIFGREIMVDWFRIAREVTPESRLFINDYPQIDGANIGVGHLGHFEETIRFLIENGAELDGIGLQGHFGSNGIPPTRVFAALDHFAQFGLPISITEYDMTTSDEALKADFFRDFYTIAFSHPAVDQILMWGFWAGAHWRPEAAMWTREWDRTPMLDMYEDLIFNQWWTRHEGETSATGTLAHRAFFGRHEVRIWLPGADEPIVRTVDLPTGTPTTRLTVSAGN